MPRAQTRPEVNQGLKGEVKGDVNKLREVKAAPGAYGRLAASMNIKKHKLIPANRLWKPRGRTSLRYSDILPWLPDGWNIYHPALRATGLRDRTTCRRLFFFKHRLRLELARYVEEPALFTGQVHHAFMETMTLNPKADKEAVVAQMDEKYIAKWEQNMRQGDRRLLEDGTPIEKAVESRRVDFLRGVAVARMLWDKGPAPSGYKVVDVEQRLCFTAAGFCGPVTCRLDLVLQDSQGRLWVKDYKTTDKPLARVVPALGLDAQAYLYRLGLIAQYAKKKVGGAIFTVVRKPGIRYCGKDATPEDYFKRVQEWYSEEEKKYRAGIVAAQVGVSRRFVFSGRIPPDLRLQVAEANRDLKATPDPELNNFPKCYNQYVCQGQYGTSCPFMEICAEAAYNWPQLLHTRYVQRQGDDE